MADGIDVRLSGLDGVLDVLKQLPAEVVSKRGGPVRRALRKGAVVIFKQARANLQASTAGELSTGLLIKNLVVTRGKPPTDGKGERYLVRVRRAAYDGEKLKRGQRVGKRVTTLKTANLLEYGSSQQPAEPWLRPAFNARAAEAIKTVESALIADIDSVAKKLGK